VGGPGSGRWPRLAGLSDDERAERRRVQHRASYHRQPSVIEKRELVAATRGEVTSYAGRWGVEWIAVCRVCDKTRDEFEERVDGARWLVDHRATVHSLSPG
jgi:hypothetical protein